jgi:bifunctional non-homologous end joining protein LigD
MIAYYESMASLLLPYLRNRPLVLTRYPDGIAGKSFFQKDAPDFVPSWVETQRIYSKDANREIDYFIVNDTNALIYVANLAAIPLHIWTCRIDSLQRPDWIVLDLDPKGAPFAHVVTVARAAHHILNDLKVPNYVKTSGATGLHILLPTGGHFSHEEAKAFARLLAYLVAESVPEIATVARPLRERAGKVYIDWGQNGLGKTIVAPFSLRPLPSAPVSFPLRWTQVDRRLDVQRFNLTTVRRRRFTDPLTPIWRESIDIGLTLGRIEARMQRPFS